MTQQTGQGSVTANGASPQAMEDLSEYVAAAGRTFRWVIEAIQKDGCLKNVSSYPSVVAEINTLNGRFRHRRLKKRLVTRNNTLYLE